MEASVLWLVLWAAFALFGAPLIAWIVGIGSTLTAAATEKPVIAAIGIPLAYVVYAALLILGVVNGIIQLIDVIQLASAG